MLSSAGVPASVWKGRSGDDVVEATGAITGLTVAVAFGVSVAAKLLAPSGIAAVLIALGFKSPPLLMVLAPVVLAICAAVGAVAGLVRFGVWFRGRKRAGEGAGREAVPPTSSPSAGDSAETP